jgi:hypothetical protein
MKNNINKMVIVLMLLISSVSVFVIYLKQKPIENDCGEKLTMDKVVDVRTDLNKYQKVEKNIPGISTEGTHVSYFYNNGQLVLVDVTSYVSLARFFTSYYIQNNNVYFINSITDEWDPKKIYGEFAELDPSQGEYIVATSTREGYIMNNNNLCKYIAEKPREKTVAVTASNPEKDAKSLMDIYHEIISNK